MIQNLTDADRALLQTQLIEARSAYHSLTVQGAARVVVDQNGERVEFTTVNSARLASYITSLELKLAQCRMEVQRLIAPAQFIF
jgi:hypothetical protein